MSNESDADRQKRVEIHSNLIRGLTEVYRDNIRTFDNQILALSAGTLGLSLTFISNLVNLQRSFLLWLLIVSWALLAAAILSILFGLRFATRSKTMKESLDTGEQITGLGKYEESGPDRETAMARVNARNKRIDLYNKLSFCFFVFGLAAMIIFISINVLFDAAASPPYPR